MAAKVRKEPMTEKAITEAIAGVQPESEKSISQKQTQRKWKTLLIRLLQPGLRRKDEKTRMFESEQLKQVHPT